MEKTIKRLKRAWELSKYIRLMNGGVYLEYKPNAFYKVSICGD